MNGCESIIQSHIEAQKIIRENVRKSIEEYLAAQRKPRYTIKMLKFFQNSLHHTISDMTAFNTEAHNVNFSLIPQMQRQLGAVKQEAKLIHNQIEFLQKMRFEFDTIDELEEKLLNHIENIDKKLFENTEKVEILRKKLRALQTSNSGYQRKNALKYWKDEVASEKLVNKIAKRSRSRRFSESGVSPRSMIRVKQPIERRDSNPSKNPPILF
ncbi:hypothetical protein TRFO_11630 [Tritrichomonas foetus]|uniref:Uncharacterized protein n=1 Tax=Tritrichomonas foetus TaxID=1144522 RepID=A0A1J4J653_9EUKA|nr:hypothetical protein TRFO_11630 [Tritrichomonas foetus]|eukprot:OHS93639.1 hypothetical protein TRFO_11630 [Tritrichomonas foetus]